MRTEQVQEVRVVVDVSLTVSTRHDRAALRGIVERGVRNMFPNNPKFIRSARFAEEAALYRRSKRIRWVKLLPEEAGSGRKDGRSLNL